MEKTIKLYGQYGRYVENSKLTLVDNEDLIIKVDGNFQPNCDYVAKVKNQAILKTIAIKEKIFTVPADMLKYGALSCDIVAVQNGNTVKTWGCENLLIIEVDNTRIAIPEIEQIKQEYQSQIKELKMLLNDYAKNWIKYGKLIEDFFNMEIKGGTSDD